ncbi:MAG: glycoside hydrolase family 16 protein [Oscillospiraceae bacterium]|nr:glycoside hydrolase family 16 protein [Oscillospiraceae bacterium]
MGTKLKQNNNEMIAGASITKLNTPTVGNYPDSLFHYARGSGSNQFTETISWDPAISEVFQPNTVYTATVTLKPGSYPDNLTDSNITTTFRGVQLSNIGNLPTTAYSITSALDGDSMVITITFPATGATFVPPKLLFNDDFIGTAPEPTKWNLEPSWERQGNSTWNPGATSATIATNLVMIDGTGTTPQYLTGIDTASNGNLVLKYALNTSSPAKIASQWIDAGAIATRMLGGGNNLLFGNAYGYYASRILPAKTPGVWSAFWLITPTQVQNPYAGVYGSEMDILETIDNHVDGFNGANYWNGYGNPAQNGMSASGSVGSGTVTSTTIGINIYDGNYHTFGFSWSPTQYVWYVDNIPYFTLPTTPDNSNICQNPNYLQLTLERAIWSCALPGNIVAGQTYVGMTVDWVQVWNQPPSQLWLTN